MHLSDTRLASLAFALLALLALCQLSAPVAAGRTLMDGPSKREREQLAAQEAELAALVADGQAQHAQQAADEAAKLDDAAAEQAQREKEQLADQQAELAELAKRGGAQQEEVEALEKAARKAKRKAEREARKSDGGDDEEKETRKSRREEDSSSSSDSNDSSDDSNNGSDGEEGSPRGRKVGDGFEMDAPRVTKESGSGEVAYATYHYYAPNYETSSLYCADVFQSPGYNKASLLDRPWTAYCNDEGLGPMSQDKCGKSLCVTNISTGQTVKMVVVDMCGQGGVDMDPLGFNSIDGNNKGYQDGHMDVKLRWC